MKPTPSERYPSAFNPQPAGDDLAARILALPRAPDAELHAAVARCIPRLSHERCALLAHLLGIGRRRMNVRQLSTRWAAPRSGVRRLRDAVLAQVAGMVAGMR